MKVARGKKPGGGGRTDNMTKEQNRKNENSNEEPKACQKEKQKKPE